MLVRNDHKSSRHHRLLRFSVDLLHQEIHHTRSCEDASIKTNGATACDKSSSNQADSIACCISASICCIALISRSDSGLPCLHRSTDLSAVNIGYQFCHFGVILSTPFVSSMVLPKSLHSKLARICLEFVS